MPDERLASLHLTIEYAIARTLQRFKNLQDKDIEWVLEQYRNYFQAVRQGKAVAEPDSTRRDRSELMGFIWECLVKWEEADGPTGLLDGSFRPGGRPVTMVEELYVMGFNDLRKSCRLHRKQDGPRGYVKFVQGFVAHALAQDPTLEELLDPAIPVLEMALNFDVLLEKRGYHITLDNTPSGDPVVDELIYEDDSENDPTISEFEELLKQYPNNRLLRAEYAVGLGSDKREEEAIMIWQKLLEEAPDHPYYLSAYLNLLLHYDNDRGFEEAERLDFQFELNKYPFDANDGYSVATLLVHAVACINMALHGRDMPYALELLDDLVRTGIPYELLYATGSEFIHDRLLTLKTEEITDEFPLGDLLTDFPERSAATGLLMAQWADTMERLR